MSDLPEFTQKVGLDRNIVKLPETEEDWKEWKNFWAFVKPWHHGLGYFTLPISAHTHHDSSSTILFASRPGTGPIPGPPSRADVHVHDVDQYYVFIGSRGEGLKGKLLLGEKEYEIGPNTAIFVPKGTPHAILKGGFANVTISFLPTPIYK